MTAFFQHKNRLLFSAYLFYLIVLTLSPFQFSVKHLHELSDNNLNNLIYAVIYFNPDDMITNILLFIPFGFLYFYFFQKNHQIRAVIEAMIAGGFFSFVIEFMQLFLERSTNITDIVMNALGSGTGFMLAKLWQSNQTKIPRISEKIRRNIHLMALIGYGAFIIAIGLLPRRYTTTKWWNPDFPLLIGNEGTMDRPWKGDVYFLALYHQALTAGEAQTLYQSVPDSNAVRIRQPLGIVAVYPLTEGYGDTIHDAASDHDKLALTGQSLQWLPGGGIQCQGGLIKSLESGEKIVDAVKQSQEFSIEIWCRPGNLDQRGPARIVSMSPDPSRRNFCLAQEGHQMHFRFRTPIAGPNGSDINLRAANVLNSVGTYHLIATFSHGVEQLYVNGRRHPDVIYGYVTYLPVLTGLGGGLLSEIGFIWGLLFPLYVFALIWITRRDRIFSVLYAFCIVIGIDMFYVISYGAPVCWIWIGTCITAFISAWLFVKLIRMR